MRVSKALPCDVIIKIFQENSKFYKESERDWQNKSFLNQHIVSITFLSENYRLSKILFFHCFYIVVAIFCQSASKINRKHKLLELIAPKQVKIDMPCMNKKSLNLSAFSDTIVSFLINTKILTFFDLFTNSKQRLRSKKSKTDKKTEGLL